MKAAIKNQVELYRRKNLIRNDNGKKYKIEWNFRNSNRMYETDGKLMRLNRIVIFLFPESFKHPT